MLSAAAAVAAEASLFFAVGSSLQVYPAAGLVEVAASGGARLVIVNAEPAPYDPVGRPGGPRANRDGASAAAGRRGGL